ncbi:udp-n-acetylglucosamine--peptide n-acetylglucosaminyltransferase spindly [Hordeum vulgare]|nr:udp-n-acetylglucosamine--peptide n-acetylglucosaminyltransferase spindly [Hordeum vulgare]
MIQPNQQKSHPRRLEEGSGERSGKGEKEKREGAATKMTERFEDILAKEEASAKSFDVKKACKVERFNILMVATEKKLKLEENKVEIAATTKDSKMLSLKMEEVDNDARTIVQAVRLRMLKHLKDQLETTEKEASKKEADGEEEAAEWA